MPAVEEEIESKADPEAYGDVRDEDAGEEIGADCGKKDNRGPETGLRSQEAAAEEIEEEGQEQDAEVKGEAGAPGVDAEEFYGDCGAPVGKRGFFEITDVVFVEGDPIVADEDFAASVGVRGVNIVEEGRSEEAGAEDGEPEEGEDDERGPSALSDGTNHFE